MNIYYVEQQWRRSGKRKETVDETHFTTKIAGKTSLGPSYLFPFVKFSLPVTRLMAYHAPLIV